MEKKYFYVGVNDQGKTICVNADNKKFLNKKNDWIRFRTKKEAAKEIRLSVEQGFSFNSDQSCCSVNTNAFEEIKSITDHSGKENWEK